MKVTTYDALTGEVVETEEDDSLFDASSSESLFLRIRRNSLIQQSDWTQFNDSPLTAEQKEAWAVYRQQLRDLPADPAWPYVEFPEVPA